jgi:hypothetical protein
MTITEIPKSWARIDRIETLERELAAMTAERDAALNERNHFVGCLQGAREAEQTMHENRNTLMRKLQAMTAERDAWQQKFARRLQAVDDTTARAELAERQVAVLCTRIGTVVDCGRCPAKKEGCWTKCDITIAAWSRAEAVRKGARDEMVIC